MLFSSLSALLPLLTSASVLPLNTRETSFPTNYTTLCASTLIEIDPNTSTCDSPASFPDECRTAIQAAPPISSSFARFGLDTAGERAAAVALMLYESGSFKFNRNHFPAPGRPGQGTRNMQVPEFNKAYATELFGAERVAAAEAEGGMDAVLELVSGDWESFASAAWFMRTYCTEGLRAGLREGSDEGWEKYITGCVGTTMDQGRLDLWEKAKKGLGI